MDELEEEQPVYKYAKPFGKKEKVLNFTSNAYQLTRPSKVGAVMELIRECQPKTFQEWRQYYFDKAHTKTKVPIKVTQEILNELGERLYEKITEVVIPEWTEAFRQITKQDCYDYVYEVTIPRTFDGFLTEKSVINDFLAKKFPDVVFEESDSDLDHSGDIDYIGKVGDKAFGIQIKPVTANSNFGNYKLTERMHRHSLLILLFLCRLVIIFPLQQFFRCFHWPTDPHIFLSQLFLFHLLLTYSP